MAIKQTHTFALLELSESAFDEIKEKLKEAGYEHAFMEEDGKLTIDMHGIGVTMGKEIEIRKCQFGHRKEALSLYSTDIWGNSFFLCSDCGIYLVVPKELGNEKPN